jgi:hypothetical protein
MKPWLSFEVDPSLVAEALSQGRKLWIEIYPTGHRKAILGEPSPDMGPVAIAARQAQARK